MSAVASPNSFSKLCVFCGSKLGQDPQIEAKTKEFAQEMVKRKIELVYGGGTVGVMGVLAREIQNGGGKVTGIIPESLAPREVSGAMIGEVIDMHSRKLQMYQKADAFVALPGGFGTFEELMEVITWLQLGIHSKPIGGYYNPLIELIQNGSKQGFISEELARTILVVSSDPIELLEKLASHKVPTPEIKWMEENQI